MLRKMNLFIAFAAMILFVAAQTAQAQCICSNASLVGDQVDTQLNNGPVATRTVINPGIELPNAGPILGAAGNAPRWNIDYGPNTIRVDFLQQVASYGAGAAFNFNSLNPQLPGCPSPFISGITVTTNKPTSVFNVAAATSFTANSVKVPIAGTSTVDWLPGEFIIITLRYSCEQNGCCDQMRVTPIANPPLQQTYKRFEIFNLKYPSSNICSVDVNFNPLPHTTFWQGGQLYINSGSGLVAIAAGTRFVFPYTRVPNAGAPTISAVPSSPTTPSLRFNLGFDNTQPYTGTVTLKVNHCDGSICTLTHGPWTVLPISDTVPFRYSVRELNAEFSELLLTYDAERGFELPAGVAGAKWLGLTLLNENAEIYSIDGAEVGNEKTAETGKRFDLSSSSNNPRDALFEFNELLNPKNFRDLNGRTITVIIKKNGVKRFEPQLLLSLFDDNANLIASEGQK